VRLLNNLIILNANDANGAGARPAPISSLKINSNKGFQRASGRKTIDRATLGELATLPNPNDLI
jgi:hypothetical protein